MMRLIDIREPDGPYGAAYQATRARDGIIDNPDMVPDWFVARLARERVAAARVALEQLGAEPMDAFGSSYQNELGAVHAALRTIEGFIREHGPDVLGARDQVVAGLLGAQEIATERENRDFEREHGGAR